MGKKYIKSLSIILGIAILFLGLVAFFVWYQREQDKKVNDRVSMYLENTKLEIDYKNSQQKKLETCLLKANAEFKRVFTLNSVEGTTPSGDKARRWNNADAEKNTEDNYRNDKEFCLKLYK